MKINKTFYYISIICIISGSLLGWQFKSYYVLAKEQQAKNPKADLVQTIKNLEAKTSNSEMEISKLRNEIASLQEKRISGEDKLGSLQKELLWFRAATGLTPVSGPGIVITLDDNVQSARKAKEKNAPDYNPEKFIIHDKNILYLVNELKIAGAEAISVNDQRIVAGSDIRCVGTVILINSTRLAPPYEIKAIGNPAELENKIANGEEYPYLKFQGFPVSLEKKDDISIPSYIGSFNFQNAKVYEPEETEVEKQDGGDNNQ